MSEQRFHLLQGTAYRALAFHFSAGQSGGPAGRLLRPGAEPAGQVGADASVAPTTASDHFAGSERGFVKPAVGQHQYALCMGQHHLFRPLVGEGPRGGAAIVETGQEPGLHGIGFQNIQ